MLFNSWSFCAFLPVVFLLHYLRPSVAWQAGVLTLASLVFYGWENAWLLPLLVISTIVNAEVARRLLEPARAPASRRAVLLTGLVFNLGALGFFKYAGLIARTLGLAAADIPLPVGISFYTFQGISLVVDAYRCTDGALHGLRAPQGWRELARFHEKVWFFKAFFPQLVAGPIVKAGEFLPQIATKRLCDVDWDGAVKHLIAGFFLKMVIADNLKEFTVWLHHDYVARLNGGDALVLLYAYSMQIFADFCGYSLIAIGLGKLFGYELPVNFLNPYLSRSITEFWQRWHLSLSTWLRQYLYIPLGGNRGGEWKTYRNLFLVMFLGGLWHGAAWNYAIWGTAHGVLLAIERATNAGTKAEPGAQVRGFAWLRVFVTFNVVSVLWLLFVLGDFADVLTVLGAIAREPLACSPPLIIRILIYLLPVICWQLFVSQKERFVGLLSPRAAATVEAFGYAVMLLFICTNAGSAGSFIYFQF